MLAEYKFDAILVLGSGLSPRNYRDRVATAVKLYEKGVAPLVIFSGRYWGGLMKRPAHTEAAVMAEYAHRIGLPRRAIVMERYSKNTTGNFYFVRKLILEPRRLRRLIIITRREHLVKAKYMAQYALGSNYSYKFVTDGNSEPRPYKGHFKLSQIKHEFVGVKFGDMRAVAEVMRRSPYYKKYKKIL